MRLTAMGSSLGIGLLSILIAVPTLLAQTTSTPFTDVPSSSPVFAAVEYLKSKNIIQTAPTFNPSGKLTRAQAAKILVAPLVSESELAKIPASSFSDVPTGTWFMPYVEAAKLLGIVDAAPTFNPDKGVTKAAFIKMLLASKKIDWKDAFRDIKKLVATDMNSTDDWIYPVIRYALASSMTAVAADGTLSPGRELTRADMALLFYRLDMYLVGRRAQALLSQTETDISNVLEMLAGRHIEQAEYASARAVITARGALAMRPDEPIVKGAMKIAEGFDALVMGYKAGAAGQLDLVIEKAKAAFALAEKAKVFSPGLKSVADQMEQIAKNMADEARRLKAEAAAQ